MYIFSIYYIYISIQVYANGVNMINGKPHCDIAWASKLMDSNIADSSDPVTMEKFKRILRTAAEDGGSFFRAITILDGLQVKIDRSLDNIEQTLDA